MLPIRKVIGCIFEFALLYCLAGAVVVGGFTLLGWWLERYSDAAVLVVMCLMIASAFVLAFLIGSAAARRARGGAMVAAGVGVVAFAIQLFSFYFASYFHPEILTSARVIPLHGHITGTVPFILCFAAGGYVQSWRAKRRAAREAIKTNEGG